MKQIIIDKLTLEKNYSDENEINLDKELEKNYSDKNEINLDKEINVSIKNIENKNLHSTFPIKENKEISSNKIKNKKSKIENENNILNMEDSPYSKIIRQTKIKKSVILNEKNESIWSNFTDFININYKNILYIIYGNIFYIFYWGIFNYNLKFPMICFYEENNNFCNENELKIKFIGFTTVFLADWIFYCILINSILKNKKKKIFILSQLFIVFLLLVVFVPLSFGDLILYSGLFYFLITLIFCALIEKNICKNKLFKCYFFGFISGSFFGIIMDYILSGSKYKEIIGPFLIKILEEIGFFLLKFLFPKTCENFVEIHLFFINYILIVLNSFKIGIFLIIDIKTFKFWRGYVLIMLIEILTRNNLHKKLIYYVTCKKFKRFKYPSVLVI